MNLFGVVRNMTIAAFVALALVAVAANIKLPQGYRLLVVQSGSMEPKIGVGSVILTKPTADFVSSEPMARFLPGEVIAFSTSKGTIVSHRVVDVVRQNGSFFYKTKGDANKTDDSTLVGEKSAIGKMVFAVPYIGRFVNFAKTPMGYFLMILIPSLYVILSELLVLVTVLRKTRPKIPAAGAVLPAVLLIFATGFYFIGGTAAYFSATAQSTNNIFTTGQFPQPIAQTLVVNEILPFSSCSSGQTNGQFLELWNGSGVTVNLKNFKLTDGTSTIAITNSNTNLADGAFAVLVKSNGVTNSCLGGQISGVIYVNLGGQLDLNTRELQLLDSNNVVIDTIRWGSGEDLQPSTDESIERDPTGLDTALDTNFNSSDFEILTAPTPGI